MTITREIDGKTYTFELTEQEQRSCFEEQQRKYDENDVEYFIKDYFDDAKEFSEVFEMTPEQALSWKEKIASRKRKYQDEYGDIWSEAVRAAIEYYADDIRDGAEQGATA